MKVFLDTNIIIDILGMRSNYASAATVLQMGVVTVILLSQLYVTSWHKVLRPFFPLSLLSLLSLKITQLKRKTSCRKREIKTQVFLPFSLSFHFFFVYLQQYSGGWRARSRRKPHVTYWHIATSDYHCGVPENKRRKLFYLDRNHINDGWLWRIYMRQESMANPSIAIEDVCTQQWVWALLY